MAATTLRRVRWGALAGIVLAALILPLVPAGASDEVLLTGYIAFDHGEDFATRQPVEYTILETASERLILEDAAPSELALGTRVRVRGRRASGERLVISRGASAVTVLSRPGARPVAAVDSTSDDPTPDPTAEPTLTADPTIEPTAPREPTSPPDPTPTPITVSNKRVAVLLINFIDPTPTPAPTPSQSPLPTVAPPTVASPTEAPPTDAPPTDAPPTDSPPTESPTLAAGEEIQPEPTQEPTPQEPTAEPTVDPSPTPTPTPTATPPLDQPWTVEKVRGTYFTSVKSVASYFADVSEGRMSISGDVFGWYTLSISTDSCTYNAWAKAARDAATAAGVDLAPYTNIAYAFPYQPKCSWNGLANVVGKNSWLNGTTSLFMASHELGHNLGIHHASSIRCTKSGQRVAFSGNCSVDEYGDPFDIMGFQGQRHVSNWHRWQLGFLSDADVQTVSTTGIYRVATAQVPGGTPRVLRVARPAGDYYYLEYRQPYGQFDDFLASAPVVNGVSIRIAPHVTSIVPSRLVDTNPSTTGYTDAPLGVGRTFTDPVNHISVFTLAIDPTGATVVVLYGSDLTPPSPPADLAATALADGSVAVTWSAASDNVAAVSYRVSRNGVSLGTTSATGLVDFPAGQGATYSYSVVAIDQSGNAGAAAQAAVFVPDTSPPSAISGLSAIPNGPNSVALAWSPATDNVGVVAYDVVRDGVSIGTSATATFTDATAPDGLESSYAVSAVDAAGNVGPATTIAVGMADATPPSLEGELSVALRDTTTAELSWPVASDNVGPIAYQVSRDGAVISLSSDTLFVDAGLGQGATYAYEVVAVDAVGLASTALSAQLFVLDTVAPDLAGELVIQQVGTAVSLTWPAATDAVGVADYRVTRNGVILAETTELGHVDTTVAEGAGYEYDVRALDAAGNESAVLNGSLHIPDVTAPTAPTLSARATGATSTSLAWTAASDSVGVSGYVIQRDGLQIAALGPTVSTFVESALASDRSYVYSVRATDAAGNSSATSSATVTLVSRDVTPPSTPTGLRATALGGRRVSLTWNASTDNRAGTLRYQVWRGTTRIATVTTLSFVHRPASVGTYRYKVRALDAAGNRSSFTAYVTVRAIR